MNATRSYAKAHPIRIGLFVVLAVLMTGAVSAFALGFASPAPVEAQMVSAVTVTAAPAVSTSVSTMASTLAATVSSVVTAVTTTVSSVTVTAENNDQGGGSNDSTVTSPTDTTPAVVNVTSEPCCGEEPEDTTPPSEPPTNETSLPCCDLPTIPTTVPVTTPLVVTPTVTVIVDFCPNIAGIQNSVPSGKTMDDDGNCVSITPAPVCTLVASASSVAVGSSVTLSWTTRNVSTASINQGVGAATPVAAGSRTTIVNGNTTYTMTAIGTNGQTVTCSAPVTVTTISNPPACTLTASASSVTPGSQVTLSWTSRNVSSATIDQGVGAATPIAAGSRTVTVNQNTTYTFTGITNSGNTITCSAPVTVTTITESPGPTCALSASASSVPRGSSVNLTWTTTNAASGSIDQGVGAATPLSGGTKSAVVNADTTYTLTVVGNNGQTITCAAPVVITTGGGGGPACVLSASPTSLNKGESSTITWGGTNITSVFIDQGIGTTTGPSGSTNVTPADVGTYVYTGTFNTTSGTKLTCTATIEVIAPGCTSGCGGGGGRKSPRVVLSALKQPGEQPLAFVYLSQIPETGLELGPLGTALYWTMLILWSLAAAYLVFFTALPYAYRRAGSFGSKVKEALNESTHAPVLATAPIAHSSAPATAHASSGQGAKTPATSHHGHSAEHEHAPQGYQAAHGFRSFAAGEALTIDDIVKGLAREVDARPQASAHDLRADFAAPVTHAVEHEAPVAAAPIAYAAPALAAPMPALHHDVHTFLAALIAGDRDTVFGTIRGITRQGGSSEEFLTHAVCALDDAYRAQVDGSVCHPDIASLTASCHPSFLERLVTSLTTAVDGSYSTGVTGVKLALTRALAVVNG